MALCGDLEEPLLGLPEADWVRLAREVDTVYHCRARVNLVLPYAALRPANVLGTRRVARFLCEGRRKVLHYASTLSVFVSTERLTLLTDVDVPWVADVARYLPDERASFLARCRRELEARGRKYVLLSGP